MKTMTPGLGGCARSDFSNRRIALFQNQGLPIDQKTKPDTALETRRTMKNAARTRFMLIPDSRRVFYLRIPEVVPKSSSV